MTDHLILPPSYDCYISKYICIATIYHSTSATLSHPKKLGNISENILGNINQLRPCHILTTFASLFCVEFLHG